MKALSARETEAVELLCQGLLGKESADRMGISHDGVRALLSRAMRKMGANNGPHLAALYVASKAAGAEVSVSREVWEIALTIDAEVEQVLNLHGVSRMVSPAQSALPEIIAKMVQLAINRAMERVDG